MTQNYMLDGALVSRLRAELDDLFVVDTVEVPRQVSPATTIPGLGRLRRRDSDADPNQGVMIFVGQLLHQDSELVYDKIAERWLPHDYTPLLRRHKGQVALIAQPGVVVPQPTNPWINFWLAVATILSVLLTGAALECQCFPSTVGEWLLGMPMMLTMMVILMAHEFGHYFAARYHKVAVTLPYFIPLPVISPVGTLGAFIQLRSPFKTKRELFDIGVAGPLGGLIFAIPLIFWGVASSEVNTIERGPNFVLEGNSVFYLFVKYIVHGDLLPNFEAYGNISFLQEFSFLLTGIIPEGGGTDILMNSIAFAAWFGLFVTAMNLIPIGQLDGGHVIYTLLGDKAQVLGMSLIGLMVAAGIFLWPGWLLWAALTFFVIGPYHPPPLNDLIDLDPGRKFLAYVMIFLFVILFMPNPLQQFL
ncbi:MAG: site-2 protease family protein [Anaerolineae bacterium]|nr:site-2 protease family protein [Anaerolineae bacterium]